MTGRQEEHETIKAQMAREKEEKQELELKLAELMKKLATSGTTDQVSQQGKKYEEMQ